MQKIMATNPNNQALEIEIIRYFKTDDKKYLIFTLNEKDEQGYIKIYVSKILGLNGTLAAYDIIDKTEWENVKDLIKKIIKMNREGTPLDIEDLRTNRLINIKINGQQVFKLIENLIELLGSNIEEKEDEEASTETSKEKSDGASTTNEVTDYQKLYKELFDRYQGLIEENSKLKTQIESIKRMINEIG